MSFSLDQVSFTGQGLVRPECVLATAAGNLYVSDFRGGVSQIRPDGTCQFFGSAQVDGIGQLKPNGICLLSDGSFLVAHLGPEQGGIFRVYRDNRVEPYLLHIDGEPLPPSNFIYLDFQGRLWLTVSTRQSPRAAAYRADIADGFIALIEPSDEGIATARIVADNIGYTNEVYVTPKGNKLYVNATFARETLAYEISDHNNLSNREVIARYGEGIFPDGLTMDSEGQLWITSIVSNSLLRLNPDNGEHSLILQDTDSAHLAWVETAYREHAMGRNHLDRVKSQQLNNISSLAFGGKQLSTLYMGCLLGDSVAIIESDIKGLPPAHWHFDDN